ncbi:MAG: PhnB protein [Parasphingorhabdus sp.]|jgi:PhnB protein
MSVKAQPDGYQTVTAYLVVHDGAEAIEFYCSVFGASEELRMPGPDGKIGHAELTIGDSKFMLADEFPDLEISGPKTLGGTGVSMLLFVDDADTIVDRAFESGAEVLRPVMDQFYGDRSGTLRDPFGHVWTISTHMEDLSPEELEVRRKEFFLDTEAGED